MRYISEMTTFCENSSEGRVDAVVRRYFTFLAVFIAGLLSLPFLLGDDLYLSIYTDDLFYYIKIAENVAEGNGTTFNGVVSTNGYQPLWQLILIGLQYISNWTGFGAVQLLTLAIYALFLYYIVLVDEFVGDRRTASYLPIMAISAMVYLQAALTGMEVALLLPLILVYFLSFRTDISKINLYKVGFLACLVILTRLDAAVLIMVHLAMLLVYRSIGLVQLIKYSFGCILFPVYLFSNYYFYDTIMPVSGMAKGVSKLDFHLHSATFRSFFDYGIETSLLNFGMIVVWIVTSFIAFSSAKIPKELVIVIRTICIFTPLYFVVTAIRSDWPIWRWYFYPLDVCLVFFGVLFNRWMEAQRHNNKFIIGARHLQLTATVSILIVLVVSARIGWQFMHKNSRHLDSILIRDFVVSHPGTYAMGDRAGLPAFLTEAPFIQLEGLVMDKNYLFDLSNFKKLEDLLFKYEVNYYIVGDPKPSKVDGCFHVKEPSHSRGYSPQIVSDICWPVEAVLKKENGKGIYILKNPKS